MSISSGSTITWSDLSSTLLSKIKGVCCNIGNFDSDVPTKLRYSNDTSQPIVVKTYTTTRASGNPTGDNPTDDRFQSQTFTWYAQASNLISTVTESTVNNRWTTFLSSAGIDARSNKIIQAKEMGLAMGLASQFMAYHLKPIYSRRQVYNNIESQSVYKGCKFVDGTCTPKYTLTAIEPSNIPVVSNADIQNLVNQNIFWPDHNWGILDATNNPVNHRCYLY